MLLMISLLSIRVTVALGDCERRVDPERGAPKQHDRRSRS
jgi:hypothetical protein